MIRESNCRPNLMKARALVRVMTKVKAKEAKIKMIRNKMIRSKILLRLFLTKLIKSKTRQTNTVIGSQKTCGFWASST